MHRCSDLIFGPTFHFVWHLWRKFFSIDAVKILKFILMKCTRQLSFSFFFFLACLLVCNNSFVVYNSTSINKSIQMSSTGLVPFFRNKFSRLFQDSNWFFKDSLKIHINPFIPKISMLIFLTVCHTFSYLLLGFNRFPELCRTSYLFPEPSSPGKCHKRIPWPIQTLLLQVVPYYMYVHSIHVFCIFLWKFQRNLLEL